MNRLAIVAALAVFLSTYPRAIQRDRQYQRFSDMAQDVVNVRIYQGIHFRTADEVARKQGTDVAKWVFHHFLQPVGDNDDDDDGGGDDHHHHE